MLYLVLVLVCEVGFCVRFALTWWVLVWVGELGLSWVSGFVDFGYGLGRLCYCGFVGCVVSGVWICAAILVLWLALLRGGFWVYFGGVLGCAAGCWLAVFGFCVVVPSLCFGFLLGGLVFGEFGDCCFVVNFVCFPVVLFCDGALLAVSWWWVATLPIVLLVVVVLVVTNLVCRWACCVGTVAGLLRSGCF